MDCVVFQIMKLSRDCKYFHIGMRLTKKVKCILIRNWITVSVRKVIIVE
jgi:hypothetical protein